MAASEQFAQIEAMLRALLDAAGIPEPTEQEPAGDTESPNDSTQHEQAEMVPMAGAPMAGPAVLGDPSKKQAAMAALQQMMPVRK